MCNTLSSQVIQRAILNANNIAGYFQNTGIFDQNSISGNIAGFEWPKGSGKTAIYSTGLSIGAIVNNDLRMVCCSYKGEYFGGAIVNRVHITNSDFKVYSVYKGDNNSNPDYANWYKMIPYGAPYNDVNNNHVFDIGIDIPGVNDAAQTLFYCLSDAGESHNAGEGFGGGTLPMFNEMHVTAWCYNTPTYNDMQFIKLENINKGLYQWDSVFTGITSDPDIGNANDDYIGCDTLLNLGYCYNAAVTDAVYGSAPPAAGFIMLKGFTNKNVTPNVSLGMTSYGQSMRSSGLICEREPNGEPRGAYNMLKGVKKDLSPYMNPITTPPVQTKFQFSGDPETNSGWTAYKGYVLNCGGTIGEITPVDYQSDKRIVMGSGAGNLSVAPGDTQTVVICQLIAQGINNKNSVTKLKQLSQTAINFYNSNYTIGVQNISTEIPGRFSLFQNYPNPFNPVTNIRYQLSNSGFVTLKIYDAMGKEVETLVNEKQQAGTYEANFNAANYPSGIYFYKLETNNFSETKKMILVK